LEGTLRCEYVDGSVRAEEVVVVDEGPVIVGAGAGAGVGVRDGLVTIVPWPLAA
jgi:hypothetical protein